MPIYSPTGFLDITNATLRTSNTECQNLQIGSGNVYVTTDLTSNLVLNLENITNLGNSTSNTMRFTNATKAFTTTAGIDVTGTVTATAFSGSGAALTNIPPSAITGTLSQWSDGANSDVYIASNVGIGNVHTLTSNTLQVGANLYVRDTDANVLTVTGNVAATYFEGDGSKLTGISSTLQAITTAQATTTDTVSFLNATTGLITTANIEVGGDLKIGGLTAGTVPYVDSGKFLKDSFISITGGTTVITSNLDVTGNVFMRGERFIVESETKLINDAIIGIANNNVSSTTDIGILMQRPDANVAIIHHGGTNELSFAYTQDHLEETDITNDLSKELTMNVVGHVITQNNLTVGGTLKINTITAAATHSLQAVTNVGNVTTNTVQFTNPTTAFTTTGNVSVGGDVSISSNLKMNGVVYINATGANMVAIGNQAGTTSQGASSVAVGHDAGQTSQGLRSVAVGYSAGRASQGEYATAMGYSAGMTSQGDYATAVGIQAGQTGQGDYTTAVGMHAGYSGQGVSAVAVGYQAGETNQHDNSIILNASGLALNSAAVSSLYVKPVRAATEASNVMTYNATTGEVIDCNVVAISSAGYVGIGTNAPDCNLEIYGDTSSLKLTRSRNNTNYGCSVDFALLNSANEKFTYGRVSGSIADNTDGSEDGLLSFQVGTNGSMGTNYQQEKMRILSNGNVGIGTTTPTAKLHIKSSSGGDGIAIFNPAGGTGGTLALSSGVRGGILISNSGGGSNGTDGYSSQPIVLSGGGTAATNGNLRGGSIWSKWGGSQYGLGFKGASDGDAVPEGASAPTLFVTSDKVGIGTTLPKVPFHVSGGVDPNVSTGERTYFRFDDAALTDLSGPWTATTSIYATHAIVCGSYLSSVAGTIGASDERIKTDITDVDDGSALETLRLLKPKKYKYKDVINRGDEPVWGFIAQEVRETLPYATQLQKECLPNIYELANVSDSNVITLTNFDTSNLESNAMVLKMYDIDDKEHLVNIVEVVDGHSVRVDEDLSEWTGSVDETGNVAAGNQIFVYGQEVDDFIYLQKDAIWTVATAALQEVDRQQQADKARITALETQLTSVLTRLDALENA